jgi:hypothetical protein
MVVEDENGTTTLDMLNAIVGGVLKERPEHTFGGSFGSLSEHGLINAYMTVSRAFIHGAQEQGEVIKETLEQISGQSLGDSKVVDLKLIRRMMVRIIDQAIAQEQETETLDYREAVAKYRIKHD